MYKLTNSTTIIRLADSASIPQDEGNTDYQSYLQWLSEGNAPTPVDIPPAPTKPEIWERIKAKRDNLTLNGGCKVGTNWFLSTERARGEYTTMAIVSSGAPATYVIMPNWRTMQTGIVVDMTVDLLKQIMTAGLQQAGAIDLVAQSHRIAMEASTTPETYDFSTGWPVTFIG